MAIAAYALPNLPSALIEEQKACLYIYGACRRHTLGSVDENGMQWLRSIPKNAKDQSKEDRLWYET